MKFILYLIVIFYFNLIHSQNTKKIKFNPKKKYTQIEIDSLLYDTKRIDIDELKKILKSDKSLFGWSRYYSLKSRNSLIIKAYDSSMIYAEKSIESYANAKIKRHEDEKPLLLSYYYKGRIFSQEKKDYNASTVNYLKALELTKKHPYKYRSAIVTSIAYNYLKIGNDSIALHYYLRASQDTIYMKSPQLAVTTNGSIADIYNTLKNIKLAKRYYNKALSVALKSDYKDDIDNIYGNLGSLTRNEKKNDSTLYFYKKAIQANKKYKKMDSRYSNEYNLLYKSYINIHEGSIQEAIDSLNTIINKIKELETIDKEDKSLMLETIQIVALAYEIQKNSKKYSNLLNENTAFLNKLNKQQLKENLTNLEIKYQTKEKDTSIKQLELNKGQQKIIIKQQKIINFSLGGLLLLLTAFGILFLRQLRLKAQYEKENFEQRLLRSQMNPHFVFNALNSVCSLIENKSNNTIKYVNKLAHLFRQILSNSREEFVSLEEEITLLNNYLELQSNFSHDFDFKFNLTNTINSEEIILPPMLIQPFVENAIIHGLANNNERGIITISISLQREDDLLLFKICDNGVGYSKTSNFKTSKQYESVSGDIVKKRLSLLKKKFKVNTRVIIKEVELGGTCVELYLPSFID